MSARSLSWPGFVLAAVTCTALLVSGTGIAIALGVLLVWLGSLYLASARPPEPESQTAQAPLSGDRMGALIEHSAVPAAIARNGSIISANLAARKLLGAHIVGQDVRIALRHPDAISLMLGEQPGSTPGSTVVDGLVRRGDRWLINRMLIGEDLSVIEFLNRTAEEEIGRAHTDFVANASHELRTPLASIIGYVETLREDPGQIDTQRADRFLGTILREARRMQDLVGDLMSLSRIEAKEHERPSDRIELAPLVRRAAREAAGPERDARLEFGDDGSAGLVVRGDSRQLEQLVRNLVDNALKYGDPEAAVRVELAPASQGMMCLCVADRGEGIAPEHIPHLTRRFYRTNPGRSQATGGTGLGLAIVKHIVERHRGRIDIDSELGRGTTISVFLPMEQEPDPDPGGDEA